MTKNLEEILEPKVLELGYELEYIECVKEGGTQYVRLVIDSKNGITTEDCENVSRGLEDIVDKNVKYSAGYVLEVSSPGLERALKNLSLYTKYIGAKVLIKLYKKLDGEKELTGILKEVKEKSIILDIDGKSVELELRDIACGNTVYNFEGEK